MLACCPWQERAAPGKPLGTGTAARGRPAAAAVELGDKLQPTAAPGVDVRGKRRELVLELVEGKGRRIAAAICCLFSQHADCSGWIGRSPICDPTGYSSLRS